MLLILTGGNPVEGTPDIIIYPEILSIMQMSAKIGFCNAAKPGNTCWYVFRSPDFYLLDQPHAACTLVAASRWRFHLVQFHYLFVLLPQFHMFALHLDGVMHRRTNIVHRNCMKFTITIFTLLSIKLQPIH